MKFKANFQSRVICTLNRSISTNNPGSKASKGVGGIKYVWLWVKVINVK